MPFSMIKYHLKVKEKKRTFTRKRVKRGLYVTGEGVEA